MARSQHLIDLARLVFGDLESSEGSVPSVLKTIRRASQHGIEYNLMKRLNYHDLQAQIIEYEIQTLEAELRRREEERLSKAGVSRRKATPADIEKFFA